MKDEASLEEIERSVDELCKIHPSHVTTDKIKLLCAKNKEAIPSSSQLSEETQDITDHAKEHLKMYDELFQTQTIGLKEAIA
jgi:hypothetical protein